MLDTRAKLRKSTVNGWAFNDAGEVDDFQTDPRSGGRGARIVRPPARLLGVVRQRTYLNEVDTGVCSAVIAVLILINNQADVPA